MTVHAILQVVIIALATAIIVDGRRQARRQRDIVRRLEEHVQQHEELDAALCRLRLQVEAVEVEPGVKALRDELRRHTTSGILHADPSEDEQ